MSWKETNCGNSMAVSAGYVAGCGSDDDGEARERDECAGCIESTISGAPAHPVTAAQAHAILELTGTDTLKREMLDGMLPYLKQMMPYMPADVVDGSSAEPAGRRILRGQWCGRSSSIFRRRTRTRLSRSTSRPAGKHMITVMPKILQRRTGCGIGAGAAGDVRGDSAAQRRDRRSGQGVSRGASGRGAATLK